MQNPFVSWLIPTTLHDHRWWKRLVEFLEEDFPAEHVECIFVGTQDKDFQNKACRMGEHIYHSLAPLPHIADRWRQVRFIGQYNPTFNISASRNILLEAARGEVVIYRDADTALLRHGFTRFAVSELLRSRYGILSFPSLHNGSHFKPKPSLITNPDPYNDNLLLACSVNGMATVGLKSVFVELGGWNKVLRAWGEHTALCTKMARAGLLMGYTNNGYWLSSATGESSISLTDDTVNPESILERRKGIALLQALYDIKPGDTFWDIAHKDYGVNGVRHRMADDSVLEEYGEFASIQQLDPAMERYDFKPWDCLSHPNAQEYIRTGRGAAQRFFKSIDERYRKCRTGFRRQTLPKNIYC